MDTDGKEHKVGKSSHQTEGKASDAKHEGKSSPTRLRPSEGMFLLVLRAWVGRPDGKDRIGRGQWAVHLSVALVCVFVSE